MIYPLRPNSNSVRKPNKLHFHSSMAAFTRSIPCTNPIYPPRYQFHTKRNITFSPKLPLKTTSLRFLPPSPRKWFLKVTEQDILEFVADSTGNEDSLPIIRTYENDLSKLTLVGTVDFEQALRAAAADGGEAADEHTASGLRAMVVETYFPGSSDKHSTVSTRLFLPVRKVKEKARKLKSTLTEDILSSTSTRNILAMTFRQVVLQQLWNFELVLFTPGTERNMKDLGSEPQQVLASFVLSSSDEHTISLLAEVVCVSALQSTKSLGQSSNSLFNLFYRHKRIISKDSSVVLYKLLDDEILRNTKTLLEKFSSEKTNSKSVARKSVNKWWAFSVYDKLEKIGGAEFADWVCEYVPAYRLQIDGNRLENVKLQGWKNSAENWREVLLTHSQLVSLANILDMYYEDMFTLPYKRLSSGVVAKSSNLPIKKGNSSLLKIVSGIIMGGFILVTASVLSQLYLPSLRTVKKYPGEDRSLQSSSIDCIRNESLDASKLEDFCVSVVRKIKEGFVWPDEIISEGDGGAWTGVLPKYLEGNLDISLASASSDEEIKASVVDILSYQVVLSANSNKIVGFQPTSRAAVNHWAANPLAEELYNGRKLSPGFIEPGVKISRPSEVVVLELLMSVKPDSYFALARPVKSSLPGLVSENL